MLQVSRNLNLLFAGLLVLPVLQRGVDQVEETLVVNGLCQKLDSASFMAETARAMSSTPVRTMVSMSMLFSWI